MSPSSSSSSSSSSSAPRCPVPSKAKNCRCACDAVSSSGVDRASGDPTVGLRGLPGPFGGFALRPDCQGEDPCGVSTIAEPYVCQQDDGDTVVVSLDAQTVYWFDRVDGEYVVRHEDPDSGPSLTHDQVNHYYILTLPDGSSFRFHDHDQATYDAGSFDRITAPGGRVTQATSHSGGTVAEVQTETTSGGSTYKTSTLRTFVDGGEHDGRLQTVTTRRQEDGGDWTDVRKMEYTYYADEAAGGNSGDVETVKVENHDGTQWTEVDRLYLRHYTDDQATGAAAGHVRFVLGRAAFEALADDPGVADPLAASDAQVAQYADQALLYDDDKRVSQQTVAAGTLQYAFDYSTNDVAPDGYNNWYHRTVETRPDGSEEIVYTNHVRQLLLRDLVDGDDHSYTYRQYDADGNLILEAGSAAVVSYNDNAQTTGMLEVTLATDEGKIVVFDYYDTTTTGGGGVGVSGLKQYDKIQQGSEGTPILLREYQYTQYTDGNGRTVYRPAGTIEYRNEDGTGGVETAYGYTWHSGTLAVEQ
ncbi:MAG: hypothetical protein HQ581_14685, partial [Planctomycetes bacterium]|nr:hypothetical protein [Planctomycetota bacterium]